jgi:nuclear receptor subfamily 5 group A protein 3
MLNSFYEFTLVFAFVQIDDQIALLINAWCELLVFSCCYRSVGSPGVIRVSNDRILTPESAREFGIEKWVEKMLNFSDQLRRLKVDYYEYVSMKVIVLLTSGNNPIKISKIYSESRLLLYLVNVIIRLM